VTGVGDGVGRVAELQDEFEDERMGEEVEIDEDELDISHHQITAIVGGFGVTDYHCSRCGVSTSRLREVQTTPCEPEDETDGQLVADGGAPQFEPGDRVLCRSDVSGELRSCTLIGFSDGGEAAEITDDEEAAEFRAGLTEIGTIYTVPVDTLEPPADRPDAFEEGLR
jgi:hypothetical protein